MLPIIRSVITRYPAVIPHLKGRARFIAFTHTGDELKDFDDFSARLSNLVKALHGGTITVPSFVDSMAALISRQITLAYRTAWADEVGEGNVPAYLLQSAESMILNQFTFVDKFAREIRDGALADGSVQPFLARVPMWANRYTEAYNEALRLIALQNGGKLVWVYGDADHCETCLSLNGIVAYASEWEQSGVKPQNAPNNALVCGGWRCQCSLQPTDAKRTRKVLDKIRSIAKA